jgi:lipid-A-disaccharide synthase-like uncharacterized protein
MGLSGLLSYAAGARDLVFLMGVLVAFFPMMVILQLIMKRIWTPKLRLSGRAAINIRNKPDGA